MSNRCEAEHGTVFLAEQPTDLIGLAAYRVLTPAFTGKLAHPSAVHNIFLLFWKDEPKTPISGRGLKRKTLTSNSGKHHSCAHGVGSDTPAE